MNITPQGNSVLLEALIVADTQLALPDNIAATDAFTIWRVVDVGPGTPGETGVVSPPNFKPGDEVIFLPPPLVLNPEKYGGRRFALVQAEQIIGLVERDASDPQPRLKIESNLLRMSN